MSSLKTGHNSQKIDSLVKELHLLKKKSLTVKINTNGKEITECNKCNKKLTKRSIKGHIAVVHEGIKKYKCQHCEKTFGQKFSLTAHTAGIKKFKCENFKYICVDNTRYPKCRSTGENRSNGPVITQLKPKLGAISQATCPPLP